MIIYVDICHISGEVCDSENGLKVRMATNPCGIVRK